jgi:hypothetical protein
MVAGRGSLGRPVLHLFCKLAAAFSPVVLSLVSVLVFELFAFELDFVLPPPTSNPHFLFGFCFPESMLELLADTSVLWTCSSSQKCSATALT